MRLLPVLIALLLVGCGGGSSGGGSVNTDQPAIYGWTQQWTADSLAAPNFTFPSDGSTSGGVHYMLEPPPPGIAVGKTLTVSFSLTGTGTWGSNDPSDTAPPGTVHLYLNERGDNFTGQGQYADYRQFCGRTVITSPGTYTVSCVLDPTKWTGVFGANASSQAFAQLVGNLYAVGITFGGSSFAGHGLYVKSGSVSFALNSFTVQ